MTALLLGACGEPGPSTPPDLGGSGGAGSPGTGGTAPTTGGAPISTGGAAPTTGGAPISTGGIPTSGGVSSGGATTGGLGTSGGTTTGGFGTTTGGFGTSGGAPTGGFGTTGGASTGGSGTTTGGFGTTGGRNGGGGGSSSGGASSGGTSSGGTGGGSTGTITFAVCSPCHGAKGEGVTGKGPEIQHPVRDFATWVIRNGRQGHPSFPNQVMAAYTTAALPDATLTTFFDMLSTPTLPKPTTGAALFADFCANCHGATGAGGPAGHDAKGEPLSKALQMVRSGHSLTQFSSRTGYMPKWTTTELTDAEVGLIVTYLDSL